jgi:hypothetical protein
MGVEGAAGGMWRSDRVCAGLARWRFRQVFGFVSFRSLSNGLE